LIRNYARFGFLGMYVLSGILVFVAAITSPFRPSWSIAEAILARRAALPLDAS